MNLSFSTRGWNHLSWDEQVRDAEEMGFSLMDYLGIEKPNNFSCFSDGKKRSIGIGNDGKRIGGNRCIIDKEEKPQTGQ